VPWIESHADLRDHPKLDLLSELLGIPRRDAVGLLHYVWWRALTYAPAGDLSVVTDSQLARWADWENDPTMLVRGLTTAGFLDPARHLHDWHDYAGKWVERREADKVRKRDARTGVSPAPDVLKTSGRTAPDVRTPSGRTGPNRTGPDRTGPDHDLHPNPPPRAAEGTEAQPSSASRSGLQPRPSQPELVSADVVAMLAALPDDLTAVAFHDAVEQALVDLGFSTSREIAVPDRGDGHAGRLDLRAERGAERIALELDDRTPRQKSVRKLQPLVAMARVIVLRCPFDEMMACPLGVDLLIGAGIGDMARSGRPAHHLQRDQRRGVRRGDRNATPPGVPTDPAAYTSGPFGTIVAERMAAKLSGPPSDTPTTAGDKVRKARALAERLANGLVAKSSDEGAV
jgi:hypothetical protein